MCVWQLMWEGTYETGMNAKGHTSRGTKRQDNYILFRFLNAHGNM